MEFSFELVGSGWARASISDRGAEAELTASYLGNALGDLLAALGALVDGAATAECLWDEEPGAFRWRFARRDLDVHLIVDFLDDEGALIHDPDVEAVPVFQTTGALVTITKAIADGTAEVLARYGEEGYLERWDMHPFPVSELRRLQSWLGRGQGA